MIKSLSKGRGLNVIYVVSEFYPIQNAVSIRTKFNVDALLKLGHSVTILTGPVSKGVEGEYCVKTVRLRPPSNKSGFVSRLLREVCFGLALGKMILWSRNVDHIIVTTPPFFMTMICVACARIRGIPYSIDVRDRYPQVFFSLNILKKNSFLGRLLRKIEIYIYRKAKNVTTVTSALVDDIQHDADVTVTLIMNGFDPGLFKYSHEAKGSDKIRIVMHGTFGKFFDDDVFFKLAGYLYENCPQCEFVVLGFGPKIDVIRQKALANIKVMDPMPQNEVGRVLSSSDIGLSIHTDDESMKKAFPVKIFEYIGACLPIVVLPENEGGRLVRDAGMGRTYSNNEWMHAAKYIMHLVESSQDRLAAADRVRVARLCYSRDAQASKFSELF